MTFCARAPTCARSIREVHPEVSFCELVGHPMEYSKKKQKGRDERQRALHRYFSGLDADPRLRSKAGFAS